MKKLFLSMSLMLAALTLTNCTKDAAEDKAIVDNGKGFSFTANIDTRATLEGVKTVWEAGDQIGLGGSIDNKQESNGNIQLLAFDYVSGSTFNNAEASYADAQTFYAIYPYTESTSGFSGIYPADHATRANQTTVFYVVGSKGEAIQDGASAAHIPAVSPMYYVSADAVSPAALAVQLHHTTSLMKFTVTNGEDAALTVKSLRLTVPSTIKICGTFYIDIATGELISSGANYTYSAQTVSVENAPALAKGESFDVYMAVAPFELAANDMITVVVTASDDTTCTIEKKMAAATAFEAGKLNTATVNFVKDAVAETPMTVSELVAKINAGSTTFAGQKVQGIVAAFAADSNQNLSFGTVILTDNTGELNSGVRFYGTAAGSLINTSDLTVGDELVISLNNATAAERGGATQITGVLANDVEDLVSYENALVAKEVTIADYNANALAYDNLYLKFVDVTPAAASVGATANQTLTFTQNGNDLTVYNRSAWADGKDIVIANITGTLYGFGQYYNAPQVVPMTKEDIKAFEAPFTIDKESVSFTADGGSETVNIAFTKDGYTLGTVENTATWLTVTPASDGTILFTAAANTDTVARDTEVTVAIMKDGAAFATITIAVSQKAFGAIEEFVTDVLTWQALGLSSTATSYSDFSNISITSDAVYAGCATSGAGKYIQLRSSDSKAGIVTTKSGGYVRKIVVNWNSSTTDARTLDVYGSDTEFASSSELYNTTATKIGSINKGTQTTLEITGNYPYIGMRSNSGAMYIDSIEITYEK